MSATSYAAFSVAVTGLFAQPQLSSMPATSLPPVIGHCSSASSTLLQLSSPRWQRPLTTGAPPQALTVAPQVPPAPQSAATTHRLATQVPPPRQAPPATPGVVQTVPGLLELAEQRPDVAPAVHTLLHISSGSSIT